MKKAKRADMAEWLKSRGKTWTEWADELSEAMPPGKRAGVRVSAYGWIFKGSMPRSAWTEMIRSRYPDCPLVK